MNNDKKTAKNRVRATSAPPMVKISQHGLYTPKTAKTVVSQKLVKSQCFRRKYMHIVQCFHRIYIVLYSLDGQCCYKLKILNPLTISQ